MKKLFSSVMVIIGTIIGAGFASGKEIYIFFYKYQKYGFWGLVITSILLGAIIYAVIRSCQKNNIDNYECFLRKICKSNSGYSIIKFIINTFLLMTFYVMASAFGEYFKQEFNIIKIIGIAIIVVLSFFILIRRTNGLIKVNTILVPVLIISIIYFGKINPYNITNVDLINNGNINWFISSIIYASYNSIILIPVIVSISDSKVKPLLISAISSMLIFILGSIIFFLLPNLDNIDKIEIPTLYIMSNFNIIYKYIFGIVILISIFTSCISCGNAFLENFNNNNYKKIAIIICSVALVISELSFSNLVNVLYPFFGVLGLLQIGLIIKQYYKQSKIISKNP